VIKETDLSLPKLTTINVAELDEFIESWRSLYDYANAHLYQPVHNDILNGDDLKQLYVWKNNMPLSAKKETAFNTKIQPRLNEINELKKSDSVDLDKFFESFKPISTVWKIFLLHIIKPKKFPIYDQHVHRAYLFIHRRDFSGIDSSLSNRAKLHFYRTEYLPWVRSQNAKDLKQLDEALFAFGQFLNIGAQQRLVTSI
jgi:hypothetical protein